MPPTPTPLPLTEVNFTGLVTTTNLPSQVQVTFSLRDQEGHAIVRPPEQIEQSVRVYERGPGTNGEWEEIDYTETSFFVSTAENIDLEIVFVLDFTNSMAAARLRDGRNGIEAMLDAFEASLAVLPSAHRVGVVEFHDRNTRPSVLSPLTTDRQAVLGAARDFLRSGFDPASSRVWDSLVVGADLFSSRAQNPRAVRALVFLSDGRDTSSELTREQAARYAGERGAQLYAVGVGEVFQENELRSTARSTDGGAYYSARDLDRIQEQIQLLVSDLRGQYQLTYITLRRTGEYRVGLDVEIAGVLGQTAFGPFDVARFFGPDNQGVIEFDPPTIDRANQRAAVFMRALHVPRNIDRIRFKVDTPKPLRVDLVASRDGGLLEGWDLSGPDAGGWYEANGAPLEFGSLGLLARLTFSNVTEDGLGVPIEFDNSIYTGGKTLARSTYVGIGDYTPPRIAFTSDRDGNGEIYVMNADGSGQTRLTDNDEWDCCPTWSPDGRRIAFISHRHGPAEIYVMNADGSGQTRLTDTSAGDCCATWSPDGRRIAFISTRDGNEEIYVMNADGSGQTRLTDNEALDWDPQWSPDGRRIAFYSYRDDPDMTDDDRITNIYVMNADGSGQTRLTDNEALDWDPNWSPDGRRIAFHSDRDDPDPNDDNQIYNIYVMNADGSGQTRLTDNEALDRYPNWSPDGRRIAFHSTRDGNGEIYVMNADGSAQTRLTDNEASNSSPRWSPDGRRIAFSSTRDDPDPNDDNRIANIYVMNADGSAQTRLTDNSASDRSPAWQPAPR